MQAGPASRRRTTAAPAALGPRQLRCLVELCSHGREVTSSNSNSRRRSALRRLALVRSLPCELGDLGRDRGAFRVAVRSPDHNVPGVECGDVPLDPASRASSTFPARLTECVGALTAPGDAGHDHSPQEVGHVAGLSAQNLPSGRSPVQALSWLTALLRCLQPPSRRSIHLGPLNRPGPRVSAVGTAPVSSGPAPGAADSGG